MRRVVLLGAAACSLAFASCARAGAWTQPAGEGLVILSIHHSTADEGYGADGSGVRIEDFRKTELRGYLEYGLTDWATLTVQPEWRDKRTGNGKGEAVRGLGRVDAGLRVRLYDGPRGVVSVQGAGRMPGASDRLAPANGGDTDWEIDGRVLYGRGTTVFGRSAFTDMQLGYRVRLGDPADELRLDTTAGLNVTPNVLALFQSFNSVSLGTAKPPLLPTREHKIAGSVVYRVDDAWSVQVGALAVVAGSNALAERGVFFALWRKF